MKILFCAYDQPGFVAGGINAWMQRLIPELVDKYKLEIATLFIYSGDKEQCPTVQFFNNNNLETYLIKFNRIRYAEDGVKKILKIVKKLGISVMVANNVVPALYAHKYLKDFNIPVIPVFHSSGPEAIATLSKFINDKEYEITDSVSVSNYIKNHIKNINSKNRHTIIPCGTPIINNFATYPTAKFKIIYAGRIEIEAKQIIKLTKSFINISNKHNKFIFNIYGNGSKQREVKALIKKNTNNNVLFHGSVNPDEIIDIMAQHQIFTLMSDYEGMPIALMEAMSCGVVPVCLSEVSGVNELIKDGVNGFIVKDRTTDYEDKLLKLYNDKNLWEMMSKNAKETIKNKYSSEVTHNSWFNFLREYQNKSISRVKVPTKIELDSNLLLYHDYRKPGTLAKLKEDINLFFTEIKLKIRPRARLRTILKIK
jgi:glycosyltransferase involved in cell wall biosynthesis